MSQPTSTTILLNKQASVLAPEPLFMKNVASRSDDRVVACGSDESLEEVMKRAPFSPGKQTSPDSALATKLASVDSNYILTWDAPPHGGDAYELYHSRPMSPETESSSPRWMGSPTQAGLSTNATGAHTASAPDVSSLCSSPRQSTDACSEPACERLANSPPPSGRRTLQTSTNHACSRPVINLSNGALKASSGSSPFREGCCGKPVKYSRTQSAGQELTDSLGDENAPTVRQKLAFV